MDSRELDLQSGQSDSPAPAKSLKVLILEDVPSDAELMQRTLRDGGLVFTAKRVETEQAFVAALEQFAPDVVLADFKLPSYDGLSAIRLVRSKYPHLPVVVVTGALGDETAVELIKAGASDYVLKDRMSRLPTAVRKALAEAEHDAQLHKHEAATRAAQKNLYAIATYSQDAIVMMDEKMVITFWNKSAETCFGYPTEEAIGRQIYDFLASKDEADAVRQEILSFTKGGKEHVTGWTHKLHIKKRDGTVSSLDLSISFIRLEGKWNVIGVVRPQSILF